MKKPKLLITGSQGIIGKVLSNKLADKFEIIGLDTVDSNQKNYFKVDLSDFTLAQKVFEEAKSIDYIIHLAADSNPNALWDSVLKNNIISTKNLFQVATQNKVKKVIYASTIHVTGVYQKYLNEKILEKRISIQDPVSPDGYYASSKVFGEALARQYYELEGLSVICLRIGAFLADDDPTKDNKNLKIWISHDDLIQLIVKVLNSEIGFGVYYAISNNSGLLFDIDNAKKDLGYSPKNNSQGAEFTILKY